MIAKVSNIALARFMIPLMNLKTLFTSEIEAAMRGRLIEEQINEFISGQLVECQHNILITTLHLGPIGAAIASALQFAWKEAIGNKVKEIFEPVALKAQEQV